MKIFKNEFIMGKLLRSADKDGWKSKENSEWQQIKAMVDSNDQWKAENHVFTNEDLPLSKRIELAKKDAQDMIESIKQTQNK